MKQHHSKTDDSKVIITFLQVAQSCHLGNQAKFGGYKIGRGVC